MLPYSTVLCALDFEPGSERALVRAADLAERAQATLHLLHVHPLFRARHAHASDPDETFHDRVRRFANGALGADDALDVLAPVVHQRTGQSPADGVLGYAADVGADLVVVGTHGRSGLGHLILGSVAAETLRRSSVPVLVVPDQAERTEPGPGRPVLLGVDFSEHTRSALAAALVLAKTFSAPLGVAHVRDAPPDTLVDAHARRPLSPPSGLASRAEAHDALGALLEGVGVGPHVEVHVVPGRPVDELVGLARRTSAGLLIVGTHGRSGRDRLRLGSVAEGLARRSPCPVLVVPRPAQANGERRPGAA